MPINILNRNPSVRIPLRRLKSSLRKASRALGVRGQINFLLVSDPVIRRYNVRYLGHDYATDVIAFGYEDTRNSRRSGFADPERRGGMGGKQCVPPFGDIAISTDTAKRQAKDEGHSVLTETTILALHGLLHLLGYRDKKKKDKDRMWRKTDALMERVA
ncbi:MAG TPA: rRNA maturation RNase YbeY [bacterium]|nr:rRNA maturation RNase YbeY [bacterium]